MAEKSRTPRVGGDRANLVPFLLDQVYRTDAATWVYVTEAPESGLCPRLKSGSLTRTFERSWNWKLNLLFLQMKP